QDIELAVHLAIFVEPYLAAVLDGRKTIESRFGVQKRPPYLRVKSGDLILLKRSGGPVMGVASAHDVQFYQLSPTVLRQLRRKYAEALYAEDDEFWEARQEKHFATLIELEHPISIDPFGIQKRDRQGWVTYDSSRHGSLVD